MSMGPSRTAHIISLRLVLGLVAASMLSLIAFFALLAYAPDFRDETYGGAHALSKSAIGFAALRDLLREAGIPTVVDRGALNHGFAVPALTVLTPELDNSSDQVRAHEYLEPRLLILPKWLPVGDPLQRGRVVKAGTIDAASVAALLKSFSATSSILRTRGDKPPELSLAWPGARLFVPARLADIDSLQTLRGRDWQPIIVSARGGALLARLKSSDLYVLADPDLMNTHGLRDVATAAMAVSIVRFVGIGSGPVAFDVTLNGLRRSPSLLRDVFAPPFLGATFCAIFAAAVLAYHAVVRFGSPLRGGRAIALGKRALVDNTADLIRMMQREPQMAVRYAVATRNMALDALGARRDSKDADALIDALERGNGVRFAELLNDAGRADTRSRLLDTASELFRWRKRITHAA